jgi:hypothetical protein
MIVEFILVATSDYDPTIQHSHNCSIDININQAHDENGRPVYRYHVQLNHRVLLCAWYSIFSFFFVGFFRTIHTNYDQISCYSAPPPFSCSIVPKSEETFGLINSLASEQNKLKVKNFVVVTLEWVSYLLMLEEIFSVMLPVQCLWETPSGGIIVAIVCICKLGKTEKAHWVALLDPGRFDIIIY